MAPIVPLRSRRQPSIVPLLLVGAVLFGGALVLQGAGAVGDARAYGLGPIYGFATDSGFALLYFQGLLTTTAIGPGDLVFGDTIYVEFLNLLDNRSVEVSVVQNGSGEILYQNLTYSAAGRGATVFTVNLATSTVERATTLCVDGGCERFDHQTPQTLIPSGILNIGGLDLVIFSTTIEFFVLVVPLLGAARYLTRKALWAPKFTLTILLGLPHLVFGVVVIALVDYQLFDQLFGGAEFIFFPAIFAVFVFLWSLHLFNVAQPALVLRPDPQGGHRLRYHAWTFYVGELNDGRRVIVGPRKRDFISRLLGHYAVLVPSSVEASGGPAAESRLQFFESDTIGERKERLREARFRARPGKENPLDDFAIAGEPDTGSWLRGWVKPTKLYWVDSDSFLDSSQPKLSFHRLVEVPPVLDGDGNVVAPATTKRKLTWPHYVDPPAGMKVARFHYVDAPVAALSWISNERAYRRMNDIRQSNTALRATTYVVADEWTEEQIGEFLQIVDRARRPMSDEEKGEETRAGPVTAERRTETTKGDTNERKRGTDRRSPA